MEHQVSLSEPTSTFPVRYTSSRTGNLRTRWDCFRTRLTAFHASGKLKTLKGDKRLRKIEPGQQVYQYNLEKTSFEHIHPCHHAKKQLLHDLFWLPGANKVLKWVAKKYDAERVRSTTPEPHQWDMYDQSVASYGDDNNDEAFDDTHQLLPKITELEAEESAIIAPHNEVYLPYRFITNPDLVPPSPSTVYELHHDSITRRDHPPQIHGAIKPTSNPAVTSRYASSDSDEALLPRTTAIPQANSTKLMFDHALVDTAPSQIMRKAEIVKFEAAPSPRGKTHELDTVLEGRSGGTARAHSRCAIPLEAAHLISPSSAAFAAFNRAPTMSDHENDSSEPVPCRLYVRVIESYADGIISIHKGDKLFVTGRRGGYLRYEPSHQAEGWFPRVYCKVIGPSTA